MVFQVRKNGVNSSLNLKDHNLSPKAKIKNSETNFVDLPFYFHSAKTGSIAINKKS